MTFLVVVCLLCVGLGWLLRSLFERGYAVEAVDWDEDDDDEPDEEQMAFDERFYEIVESDDA